MNLQQALDKCLQNWKNISKFDFCLLNTDFSPVVSTSEKRLPAIEKLENFSAGNALCLSGKTISFYKIHEQEQYTHLLLIWGSPEQISVIGELAVCQVESLLDAYAQKSSKNVFMQRLLLGELSSVDLYNQAKKMHIADQATRVVLLIQTQDSKDENVLSTIRNLISSKSKDILTSLDTSRLIIVHELSIDEQHDDILDLATVIVDMLGAEAMISAKVSFSSVITQLSDLSNAYKEACTAMEIGKIFTPDTPVYSYSRLGLGRLIYQIPLSICELFLDEIYPNESLESLDAETLNIIRTFFENNLNLSETSRNLYVHRNSLVYRFEKLQKKYGLDVRSFEDALTFKISMMVADYVRHSKKNA
ncbi:MAG: helix-turn-helix domain-containing protein [Eubacteriales bacterium]|nr:helix-turn-helix domain-containing protein [Eubacteriales bacterium]